MPERTVYQRNEKEVQALLAWVNNIVKKLGFSVKDIEKDFSDGVIFINLLRELFDERVCDHYNSTPKLNFHKLDNLELSLNFLDSKDIRFVSLDRQQIISGNEKQTIFMLSNMLRQITLSSMDINSPSDKKSVRGMILSWINGNLSEDTPAVNDLSKSLSDGSVLTDLIGTLAPETVADESLTTQERLQAFFDVAEQSLGIPSLISAEEFLSSAKDQPLMENYFCMLISSFNALKKGQQAESERLKKIKAMEEVKEAELNLLKSRIEEDNSKLSEMEANMRRIVAQHNDQLSAAEKLAEEEQQKHQSLDKQLAALQSSYSENFQSIQSDLAQEKRNNLELKESVEALEQKILELEAEKTKVDAELYNVHKDYEHLVSNFRRDIQTQMASQHTEEVKERTEQFSTMARQTHEFTKGFDDFLKARGVMEGWFTIVKNKRTMLRGHVQTQKRVWVQLRGQNLYWSREKNAKAPSFISLVDWHVANIDQLIQKFNYSSSHTEKSIDDILEIPDIQMSPNDREIDRSIALSRVSSLDEELYVDFYAWIEEILTRISLIGYFASIHSHARTDGMIGGCREMIAFMSHPSMNTLCIENSVPLDFVEALSHFKNAMICRRNFDIVLNNVGLKNNAAKIIAEIVSKNQSISRLELRQNFITANCAKDFRAVLGGNKNLQTLDLSSNQLKDASIEFIFKGLDLGDASFNRICLDNNEITDEGACILAKELSRASVSNSCFMVQALHLDGNFISDSGCELLAQLCLDNDSIQTLHLNRNLISDRGAASLAHAMSHGSSLSDLGLARNQISHKGAVSLAAALSELEKPVVLDLSHNKLIGRKGYAEFFNCSRPIDFDLFRLYINSTPTAYKQSMRSSHALLDVDHEA